MLTIPIQHNAVEYSLCVILEDDNLTRIREYDPCEIVVDKLGLPWARLRLSMMRIYYATHEECVQLTAIQKREDALKFINDVLTRGWKFKPECGDRDGGYESVKQNEPPAKT